jgi:WD40 repeat protein
MRRIRFNIANLIVVILVLGVGFAALRESTELWESGIFTLTIVSLLLSVVLAIHRTDKSRAFWLGFALFGSAYLGLSLIPSIESRLVTTKVLAYVVESKVSGRSLKIAKVRHSGIWRSASGIGSGSPNNQVQSVVFTPDGNQIATSSRGRVRLWDAATGKPVGGSSGTTESFVKINHSLFALLVGWLGGLLSRRLCRSSSEPDVSTLVDAELTNL